MKKLMAANWKMYKTRVQAEETIKDLLRLLGDLPSDREVAVFAPFTALDACGRALPYDACRRAFDSSDACVRVHQKASGQPAASFFLGGQDVYPAAEGAFTGEISPGMLLDCACRFVLTGHSERRHILGESNEFVGRKTAFALEAGLDVVLCLGETLEEREAGKLEAVLREQFSAGVAGVPGDIAPQRLSLAYEPVWAIGTGRVAGPSEILEAHALLRDILRKKFVAQADQMRILYGGSVKPDNASQIIGLDNVDGVLVGGASLEAESFSRIVLA
ncbi:MAG: triose-phosphate isomerase [Deltaproteobacteria bacterium]|jgi:triosephosphate isomerase|nr:triose-phosphate isomerase [Deltaproteobacteria bacterium]